MSKLPKCEQEFQDEYERWKRESASINDYEACQGAFKSWIAPFLEERDFGYAALQRRCRLLSIKPVPGLKPEGESQASLPSYNDACNEGKREEELNALMEAYWISNRTLLSMDETMPLTSNVEKIDILRFHRDRHGRPYSWVMDRSTCADTGGCCGRACGCCEKPLLTYYRPMGYRYPDKKTKIDVYGHCTAECPCCIQVRHRYHPHPRLPKSAF
ncbi:hypothetical protein BDV32DRAFT_120303 [Aspergillus pseudonomiae]|uniref:Uncharacterized protein n=1 Tax=Aspergillus pseudonomiae TaxID=1506151 RepID=A0A5N7D413_9EURO|nr:uncharacterized protein BDV37DRAFT_185573 [Aspergillus pseudonomiae]KAB8262577.1 hypothetical protein BDV32DRAFT_120303 [Aspergillus pseudonomiae]KAE8401161.1 hypothetical protein BDV37DRAFT_185573 [Aspergillus pseudonomiae]